MLDTAFEALARGDAAAARAAAEAAVAADPKRAEAHHALGLALQLSGDLPAAASALERAIALAPQRAELHLARANVAARQQDEAGADASIGAALSANPNSLGAYLLALHLALAREQPDEAAKQLRLAQRVAAEHPQVIAAEGALALARGDFAGAQRLLALALKHLPENPLVLSGLALAYRAAGNLAFAEAALVKAIARQPQAVALRWVLIDCLHRQGRAEDCIEPARELLQVQPEDEAALSLLGDLLMRRGDIEAGLDAYRRLILLTPFQSAALDRLLERLVQAGMREQAIAMLETALQHFPQETVLWQRRVQAAQGDPQALQTVLSRWQTVQPDSAAMHLTCAEFAEWRGAADEAVAHAQAALASDPAVLAAEGVLLRAELRDSPQLAFGRIDRLQQAALGADWNRALANWRGLALDRLGRHAEALRAWEQSWALTEGGEVLPLLPAGAEDDAATEAATDPAPRLLWAPPGGPVRELLGLLAQVPGWVVLNDRFGAQPRGDGFGPPRDDGSFADLPAWRSLIQQRGADPARCIDWLPHWDRRIAAALQGASLLAVIADPRDLLLNWLAFASPYPLRFPGPQAAVDWLLELLEPLAQRIEAADRSLLLIRDQDLLQRPQEVAANLQQALSLDAPPATGSLAAARLGPGGLPVTFAPGHWRGYQDELAAEFARLAPLAARLGCA